MDDKQLQSPNQSAIRTFLRVFGPLTALAGIGFMIVGFASFFSAFGSFNPPRLVWCAFVGTPLLFVGIVMCQFGYMGAFYRYVAGETAPVAKDVVNYLGDNTQPGVKAVAKAVTEGIKDGLSDHPGQKE